MGIKDKLLRAAAIGASFLAVTAPKLTAEQQYDSVPQKDALVQKADMGARFAPGGKTTQDHLNFSLMGVEIDTAKFAKAKENNSDLQNVDLIQTDRELGIAIQNADTGQTYQIFGNRDQILDFSKNPKKDISNLDVTMSVKEKDGTYRAMEQKDASDVAGVFLKTLKDLDNADLIDANETLAKAANCSTWTIKMTPDMIIKGKMSGKLSEAIGAYQTKISKPFYTHQGDFLTAMNQGSSR